MELTDQQKKKTWLILGIVAALVIVLALAQGVSQFLGARAPWVDLSDSVVGGRLRSDVVKAGTNTLIFTAKDKDGTVVTDTMTFEVVVDPYDNGEIAPDPYDPYNNPPDDIGYPPIPY